VDRAGDYRKEAPVRLSVGPVLAETDAVATKVAAVFSRGYARDYLDLAGILDSGRFTRDTLIDLAASVDAGFSRGWFAEVRNRRGQDGPQHAVGVVACGLVPRSHPHVPGAHSGRGQLRQLMTAEDGQDMTVEHVAILDSSRAGIGRQWR
jgi:hypothetical protein